MNKQLTTKSEFSPYSNLTPKEYLGLVQTVNINSTSYLKDFFSGLPFPSSSMCLVTTGSDGKLERHTQSKTELIVIENSQYDGISLDLVDYIGNDEFRRLFVTRDGLPETKSLDSEVPISYVFRDGNTIYPDRILNSTSVFGDQELFDQVRLATIREMSGDSRLSKHIRGHMEDQLRNYKKSMQTGVVRGMPVFDVKNGVQFYNETDIPKLDQYGFKLAFLRAVQRKLDLITANSIKEEKLSKEIVQTFPTSTQRRLDFLVKFGKISDFMADEVTIAYAWFLQQYHAGQQIFKDTQEPVILPFDKQPFMKHARVIESFTRC